DPVTAFRANEAGDYILSIANVSFRGGPEYVYRMTISKEPYVAFAYPTGTGRDVEFFALTGGDGYRTWTGKPPFESTRSSGDPQLTALANHSPDKALNLTG